MLDLNYTDNFLRHCKGFAPFFTKNNVYFTVMCEGEVSRGLFDIYATRIMWSDDGSPAGGELETSSVLEAAHDLASSLLPSW
jgi:hypothetical protein